MKFQGGPKDHSKHKREMGLSSLSSATLCWIPVNSVPSCTYFIRSSPSGFHKPSPVKFQFHLIFDLLTCSSPLLRLKGPPRESRCSQFLQGFFSLPNRDPHSSGCAGMGQRIRRDGNTLTSQTYVELLQPSHSQQWPIWNSLGVTSVFVVGHLVIFQDVQQSGITYCIVFCLFSFYQGKHSGTSQSVLLGPHSANTLLERITWLKVGCLLALSQESHTP